MSFPYQFQYPPSAIPTYYTYNGQPLTTYYQRQTDPMEVVPVTASQFLASQQYKQARDQEQAATLPNALYRREAQRTARAAKRAARSYAAQEITYQQASDHEQAVRDEHSYTQTTLSWYSGLPGEEYHQSKERTQSIPLPTTYWETQGYSSSQTTELRVSSRPTVPSLKIREQLAASPNADPQQAPSNPHATYEARDLYCPVTGCALHSTALSTIELGAHLRSHHRDPGNNGTPPLVCRLSYTNIFREVVPCARRFLNRGGITSYLKHVRDPHEEIVDPEVQRCRFCLGYVALAEKTRNALASHEKACRKYRG